MKLVIACLLAAMACVPVLAQQTKDETPPTPTLEGRLAELKAVEAVDKARIVEQPKAVPGFEHDENYTEAKIAYTWIEGEATFSNVVAVRISERGAYWYGGVPSVLEQVKQAERAPAIGTDEDIRAAINAAQGVQLADKLSIDRGERSADVTGYVEVSGKLTQVHYYVARNIKTGEWTVKRYDTETTATREALGR